MSAISRLLNIRRQTISDLLNKHQASGSVQDRERAGRPRLTTGRQDRKIIRDLLREPQPSIREFSRTIPLSKSTIHRRLKAGAIRCMVAPKKPSLTSRHRRARLRWAKAHVNWTVEQWRRVYFTDEAPFYANRSVGRTFVRLPLGQDRRNIRSPPPSHRRGVHIMVWGAISGDGDEELRLIEGRITGETYRQLLSELYTSGRLNASYFLLQDNAPPHTARVVRDFLADHEVPVFDWPALSPDLNVIENVWSVIGARLMRMDIGSSPHHLWEAVQQIWRSFSVDEIRCFVDSMPRRIRAVIAAKGGSTKY